MRVGARAQLWIGYEIKLVNGRPAAPVGVGRVRLDYRQLGLALEQTVSLAGNQTLLACNA